MAAQLRNNRHKFGEIDRKIPFPTKDKRLHGTPERNNMAAGRTFIPVAT